jgi:hypothetical protein
LVVYMTTADNKPFNCKSRWLRAPATIYVGLAFDQVLRLNGTERTIRDCHSDAMLRHVV